MYYYEVAPAYRQLHSPDGLTYQHPDKLAPGTVVVVSIRGKSVLGFVIKLVVKPDFNTQPIDEASTVRLPAASLGLFTWLKDYYPAPIGVLAGLFLPNSLRGKELVAAKATEPSGLPKLTAQQQIVISAILGEKAGSFLLHGDTATGKSRVYIELAKKTLQQSKSVIILTPEISLTPQMVDSFKQALGREIFVTHSNLSLATKRDLWLAAVTSKEPLVLIGPRSALFIPLPDIGLIVVDEAHETAYKQEQSPNYQTSRVASKLAALSNARLVFGSATPSVSEYYLAEQKAVPVLKMTERPLSQASHSPLDISIVDLADSSEKTKYPLISETLTRAIKKSLERREQSLIFLNRRGSARIILCQQCAWQASCPRCDLPYTYHADTHSLRCHTCGSKASAPSSCPSCKSTDIIFKSPGTKAVVESLTRLFPEARIARFDKDNLTSEKFEAHFADLQLGNIDIIVGTQLVAKGHDLPRLSLVGILLADNELSFPDYTSEERSYQLIKQLLGRVGRGHRRGYAVIQTYGKSASAVKAAIGETSWEQFYSEQLSQRKLYGFPPFSHVLKIEVSRATKKGAQSASATIANFLAMQGPGLEILGPHPSFIEKRAGKTVWQLIVTSKQRGRLVDIAKTLPLKASYDLDPNNLL